jgi:arsenite oxidase large subunit
MVDAIVAAINDGGLFAVDVDIVPTKIGQACHVILPAATSGEMNLTSMNGERRMRLTERYKDPPGQAMPDCLIAARIANNMQCIFNELGKQEVAVKIDGFDWHTEEDAFMDGYHQHEKGGEHVTYERLRAMGTNGFQEPATGSRRARLSGARGSTPTESSERQMAGPASCMPIGEGSRLQEQKVIGIAAIVAEENRSKSSFDSDRVWARRKPSFFSAAD